MTYRYTVRWVTCGLNPEVWAETLRWEGTELLTRADLETEVEWLLVGPNGTLPVGTLYRVLDVQVEKLTAEPCSLAD